MTGIKNTSQFVVSLVILALSFPVMALRRQIAMGAQTFVSPALLEMLLAIIGVLMILIGLIGALTSFGPKRDHK